MNIRKATDNDFEQILSLWYKNLDSLFRPFQAELHQQLAEGKYTIIEEDGRIIALSSYKYMPRKRCVRIQHFCVDAQYRSMGCGSTLLNHLVEEINSLYADAGFPIQAECVLGKPNNEFWLSKGHEVSRRTLEKSGKTILTIEIN